MPEKISSYATRNIGGIPLIKIKHQFFKNIFLPSAKIEWNKPDLTIWNAESFSKAISSNLWGPPEISFF